MALKLNLPNEYIRIDGHKIPFYSERYGRNTEQMPRLRADGRVPMNIAQLMQRRLDVGNSDSKVKTAWMDNYFDTDDGVAYHPETKDWLIDLDSETLRGIHPNPKKLSNGAWLLGKDKDEAFAIYEQIKNKPTSALIEAKYLRNVNKQMSRKDVKADPVWKVLARDQGLLNDYTDYIFGEGKQRFNYDAAMGVFPDSAGDQPKMGAWCVGRLVYRSDACGGDVLDDDLGRLVGIAPEALSVPDKGASNVQRYTMEDL